MYVWSPTCCLTRAKSASSLDGSGSGYCRRLQRGKKVLQWCSWQTSTCHDCNKIINTLIKTHQHQDDQPANLGEEERSVQGNVSGDPCRGLLVCTWCGYWSLLFLHLGNIIIFITRALIEPTKRLQRRHRTRPCWRQTVGHSWGSLGLPAGPHPCVCKFSLRTFMVTVNFIWMWT